jgi:hypothetical protein
MMEKKLYLELNADRFLVLLIHSVSFVYRWWWWWYLSNKLVIIFFRNFREEASI